VGYLALKIWILTAATASAYIAYIMGGALGSPNSYLVDSRLVAVGVPDITRDGSREFKYDSIGFSLLRLNVPSITNEVVMEILFSGMKITF